MSDPTESSVDALLATFWQTDDEKSAAQRAEDFGIDLSLIDDNLLLSPPRSDSSATILP